MTDFVRINALVARPEMGYGALVLLTVMVGCSGGTANDVPVDKEEGPALDAGLSPGAKLEDCVSDEGVRICGTKAGCYEAGRWCNCVGFNGPNEPRRDYMVRLRKPRSAILDTRGRSSGPLCRLHCLYRRADSAAE